MIICEYQDLIKYRSMLDYLENGIACVEQLQRNGFPTGKYEFEGGYLMVQRGITKPFQMDAFETHRKYIDVQIMVEGGETAYFLPITDLKLNKEYDPSGDIEFFSGEKASTAVFVRPGMCWVAFPEDGHMPCRYQDQSNDYTKIVMKLPVRS